MCLGVISATTPKFRIASVLCAILMLHGAAALGQETGVVFGKVVDAESGKPLPFANVAVVGTPHGADAEIRGDFTVGEVPLGPQIVRATFIGYEALERGVNVRADAPTEIRFELKRKDAAGTTEKIVVRGTRPLIDVAEISTVRQKSAEAISRLAVDELAEVVSRQVGVSGEAGDLHIRGGRSDETLFRIENVAMKNVVTGAAVGGTFTAKAVENLQVITGGYEAEYGQAISGIVNVKLKEGRQKRRTSVEYHTGSFDTERIFLQTEGRLTRDRRYPLFGKMTYLVGIDVLGSDTYLPSSRSASNMVGSRRTLRSRYDNSFAGLGWSYDDFLRRRQDNSVNLYSKLTWRLNPRHKVNATYTKFVGIDHGFFRFRVGDEVADASASSSRYSWSFRDQFDQFPTYTEETNSFVTDWRGAWSDNAYTTVSVSRFFNNLEEAVQGKRPWVEGEEYDEWRSTPRDQYFVTDENGDFPSYQNLTAERYSLAAQYTQRWQEHHELKTGVEGNYHNLQMIDIANPREGEGGLGNVRDLYEVHPNDGAFFLQNSFRYEGFAGHFGLRGDYLFLGKAADKAAETQGLVGEDYLRDTRSLFGRRYKLFWSPRLAINHPITDRNAMHFNFGHFTQWPRLTYYFSKISSRSSEAFPLEGNLNLDPERSVQFEFGVKRQFTDFQSVDVTLFNKDTYDYPTAVQTVEVTRTRLVYVNSDFSRTRGLEVVYQRNGARRVSSEVSYEFQIATGKPADPNRIRSVDTDALETGEAEPELNEEFMPWNRPHRVQASFDLRFLKGDRPVLWGMTLPDQWSLNFFYSVRSGRPYTPTDFRGTRTGKRNSENAPVESVLDLKFKKFWDWRRDRFGLVLQIKNVFDTRILRRVDSNTGEVPRLGQGTFTVLSSDTSPERVAASLSNPSFYAEGRNLRLGLEVTF